MKKIRQGTFETNGSSTHSLVMLSDYQYDLLGTECFIYNDSIIDQSEALEIIKDYSYDDSLSMEENRLNMLDDLGPYETPCTFDEWVGYNYSDYYELRTPGGENIIILVKYGTDN